MKSKNIVLFSTADWDNPFWTNKQHMAVHFAKRGFKVLYIDSIGLRAPTAKASDLSRIMKRLLKFFQGAKNVQQGIWVYSPIAIPFHKYQWVRRFNKWLLEVSIKYFIRKHRMDQFTAWTYNPLSHSLIDSLSPAYTVYHSVDDLRASPGIDSATVESEEKKLIAKANIIFTTSQELEAHCKKNGGEGKTFYFPNVADYEHFSKARSPQAVPDDMKNIPKPVIGFIGAISEYKVDFDLIASIAKNHPEWHWVLIGKVGEGQPQTTISKLDLPNIHLLGPKPYEKLPQYLAHFDVATLPCPINQYTTSMFPMKFFEYLAAGKTVVSTKLPALTDFQLAGYFADNASTFKSSIEMSINTIFPRAELREECAKQFTWDNRMNEMLRLIGEQ